MTLFNSKPDKAPPKRHQYSPGFIKAYKAYNHPAHKMEAFLEWEKQGLELYADHIAKRAFVFHMFCKRNNRIQADFRRWLHNRGWEDDLFVGHNSYQTPEDAYKAFKHGEWTHCNGLDCRGLKVKRNAEMLILGDQRIYGKDQVRDCEFCLRFDV